jgi:hypothetical protein
MEETGILPRVPGTTVLALWAGGKDRTYDVIQAGRETRQGASGAIEKIELPESEMSAALNAFGPDHELGQALHQPAAKFRCQKGCSAASAARTSASRPSARRREERIRWIERLACPTRRSLSICWRA